MKIKFYLYFASLLFGITPFLVQAQNPNCSSSANSDTRTCYGISTSNSDGATLYNSGSYNSSVIPNANIPVTVLRECQTLITTDTANCASPLEAYQRIVRKFKTSCVANSVTQITSNGELPYQECPGKNTLSVEVTDISAVSNYSGRMTATVSGTQVLNCGGGRQAGTVNNGATCSVPLATTDSATVSLTGFPEQNSILRFSAIGTHVICNNSYFTYGTTSGTWSSLGTGNVVCASTDGSLTCVASDVNAPAVNCSVNMANSQVIKAVYERQY